MAKGGGDKKSKKKKKGDRKNIKGNKKGQIKKSEMFICSATDKVVCWLQEVSEVGSRGQGKEGIWRRSGEKGGLIRKREGDRDQDRGRDRCRG